MTINKNNKPVTSASQISVYVQNVRSLNTLVTSRKLTRPLDTGCDIYIFVDARVTELKLRQLWSNFKVRMSDMQLYNTNSLNRGILILCKKSSGCTIENAELVDTDSTVIFYLKPPDGDPINCAAVYGPSKDDPQYWEMVDRELSKRDSQYKCIAGDFNTTLNFSHDTTGYLTDPHFNARKTINGFIELGKYTDIYDYCQKRAKKASRIDHILVLPSLTKFCQGIKHKYSGGISDHNAIILTLDWCQTPKGPGIY